MQLGVPWTDRAAPGAPRSIALLQPGCRSDAASPPSNAQGPSQRRSVWTPTCGTRSRARPSDTLGYLGDAQELPRDADVARTIAWITRASVYDAEKILVAPRTHRAHYDRQAGK